MSCEQGLVLVRLGKCKAIAISFLYRKRKNMERIGGKLKKRQRVPITTNGRKHWNRSLELGNRASGT